MSGRRSFTEEFKAGALDLVVSSDLGIKEGTLGNWMRTGKAEHPDAWTDEPGPVEWAKYKALQAENTALKKENEFLGNASAFFAAKHPWRTTSLSCGNRRPTSRSRGCAGGSGFPGPRITVGRARPDSHRPHPGTRSSAWPSKGIREQRPDGRARPVDQDPQGPGHQDRGGDRGVHHERVRAEIPAHAGLEENRGERSGSADRTHQEPHARRARKTRFHRRGSRDPAGG